MNGRGAMRARHQFRFGGRELVILGLVFFLICALTFVFGVLVGRELTPAAAPSAKAGAASPGPPEPAANAPPARTEERLTFYRTLTAPTADLPAVGQPPPATIEERIVPNGEPPVSPGPKPEGRATPEKRTTPARVARSEPPAGGGAAAVAPRGPEPQLWTVQVSSFRSRSLAEELRARLATRGFDAHVVSAATEEGRVRYRVRVGAFSTRLEAERVAAELRERALSPFVTPRSR